LFPSTNPHDLALGEGAGRYDSCGHEQNVIASHPLRMVDNVTALTPHRFTVLDVETSGLSDRRHRILQIALVSVDPDGVIVDEWASYSRPFLWHVGPKHIHGLSARKLRREPRFANLVPEVVKRLDGTVLVAHNLEFDWPFLRRALRRSGYVPPDARRLCTLQLSRSLDPDKQFRHRLSDLAARNGVELTNAHDALADARATALILPRLLAASSDAWRLADGSSTTWAPAR
jgi:DNA polymerase III subunit epsilon